MSQPLSDRDYLCVPGSSTDAKRHVASVSAAKAECSDELAIFRAALLYIASDLRQLAQGAPAERRSQVTALSAMIVALAE